MIFDAAVIGAGTCGLFAAINLPSEDKIIIFDKNRGAKKLSITGNNRSNLTNCLNREEFLEKYGSNGNFLRDSFKIFFRDELISFLNSMGFETVCDSNRIILKNRSSKELADGLFNRALSKAVSFKPYEPVVELKKENGIFTLKTKKGSYKAGYVIMACGGLSYPKTGSDGNCYRLAEKMGHKIVKTEAFEVPFCAKNTKPLQGLSFQDIELTLKIGKKRYVERGDIIFTHFGISGPAVLKLSEYSFKEAVLFIEFLNRDKNTLLDILTNRNKKIKNLLKELMPERFVNRFITIDKYVKELSNKEKRYIADTLFRFRLDVKKCSFDRAFFTKGGVSTRHINPKTMESKIVDNLFFCGEMMDIQGSIGGFNLQAAFSTAFCAALSVKNK